MHTLSIFYIVANMENIALAQVSRPVPALRKRRSLKQVLLRQQVYYCTASPQLTHTTRRRDYAWDDERRLGDETKLMIGQYSFILFEVACCACAYINAHV